LARGHSQVWPWRPFESLLQHLKESDDPALRDANQGLGMYSDQFQSSMKWVPAMWVGGPIARRSFEIYHTVRYTIMFLTEQTKLLAR